MRAMVLALLALPLLAQGTEMSRPFAAAVRVMRVDPKSAAALRRGDTIVEMNGKRVGTPEELAQALGNDPKLWAAKFTLIRGSDALGNRQVVRLPAR